MSFLLGRLKKVVEKVVLLISFDTTRWITSSKTLRRRISFQGYPGLLDFVSDSDELSDDNSIFYSCRSLTRSQSSASTGVRQPKSANITPLSIGSPSIATSFDMDSSGSSKGRDIDLRAEEFINRFRAHLQRENSLRLAYSPSRFLPNC
ncbi:hypothetical protein ZOSMA_438G00050 [Zostera marina]|uniref:Uncharacterized protein n=1 Tax=Zostera marina TaxID=29655 RepID=A0A0K9P3Z5_ZOSMR|nr:hypothetical protein ZOSMA_438G00050 [Zostera marina]